MSYSRDPLFAQKLVTFQKTLTAAKATLTGVTDATLLITAPTEGLWITRLWIRPLGTLATATRGDLYYSADGSAALLIDDALVAATGTLTAATELPETQFGKWSAESPLYLAGGHMLYGSLSAAFATGMVIGGHGQTFTSPAVADVSAAAGTATT